MENYAYVQAHNARHATGEESYSLEMNEFADMTSEEFGKKYLMENYAEQAVEQTDKCTASPPEAINLPD